MAEDYGHESKTLDPVFVGAYSPDFVLVRGDLHLWTKIFAYAFYQSDQF